VFYFLFFFNILGTYKAQTFADFEAPCMGPEGHPGEQSPPGRSGAASAIFASGDSARASASRQDA
jgi:hypothetical protein